MYLVKHYMLYNIMFISIDVGIKNLAYVVYNNNKIIEWKVVELCETNASKANIIEIGKKLYEALENIDYDFEKAIIENQIGPNAIRMKCLQGMITMFFIGKGVDVVYWNAANKLKCYIPTKSKTTYTERKKLSIIVTREILTNYFKEHLEYFNSYKKKDDLADCFLQLMDYNLKNGTSNIICNELNIKL